MHTWATQSVTCFFPECDVLSEKLVDVLREVHIRTFDFGLQQDRTVGHVVCDFQVTNAVDEVALSK